jgi:hypothetical protein
VQQGIEGVRSRLEQNVGERTRTTNPFLPQFDRQSRIYPLIDSLGAATDLAQLEALGAVTDTERQEVPTLKAEVEALQTTNPVAQLKLAETVQQNFDALIKAFTFVKRFDFREYAEILERWRKAEQQYERATQESFAGLPIPGLLKEEWRRFIQAGEEYLKTLDEQDSESQIRLDDAPDKSPMHRDRSRSQRLSAKRRSVPTSKRSFGFY